MEPIYKDAGARIGELRKIRGMTRESLANMTGISAKFIYEIERGRKGFSAESLYKISRALNVDCDYIMSGQSAGKYNQDFDGTVILFEKDKSEKLAEILQEIYRAL